MDEKSEEYKQTHGDAYKTNNLINIVKNIINWIMNPKINSNIYHDHSFNYNPNYILDKNISINLRYSKIDMNSFLNNKNMINMEVNKTNQVSGSGGICFSCEDFPKVLQSDLIKTKPINDVHLTEELEDESSLIIISNSCSPKCTSSNLQINNSISFETSGKRERYVSDSSDDSFVICFSDNAEGLIECTDFSTSDSESEDDTRLETVKNTSTKSYKTSLDILDQPDSGFDEKSGKKVRFNLIPEIHLMYTWGFAYRAARKGEWEEFARDRSRFTRRIEMLGNIITPILETHHREEIYKSRFNDSNYIEKCSLSKIE